MTTIPTMYAVGQKFPDPVYCNRPEMNIPIITNGFFDLLMSLRGITNSEYNAFIGTLTVGLFVEDDIPFAVFDFGKGFTVDVSIDLTKLDVNEQISWLTNDGNVINLFLVDNATDAILAMRTIAVNFAPEIREVLGRQIQSTEPVIDKIDRIINKYDTNYMIQHNIKQYTFSR